MQFKFRNSQNVQNKQPFRKLWKYVKCHIHSVRNVGNDHLNDVCYSLEWLSVRFENSWTGPENRTPSYFLTSYLNVSHYQKQHLNFQLIYIFSDTKQKPKRHWWSPPVDQNSVCATRSCVNKQRFGRIRSCPVLVIPFLWKEKQSGFGSSEFSSGSRCLKAAYFRYFVKGVNFAIFGAMKRSLVHEFSNSDYSPQKGSPKYFQFLE